MKIFVFLFAYWMKLRNWRFSENLTSFPRLNFESMETRFYGKTHIFHFIQHLEKLCLYGHNNFFSRKIAFSNFLRERCIFCEKFQNEQTFCQNFVVSVLVWMKSAKFQFYEKKKKNILVATKIFRHLSTNSAKKLNEKGKVLAKIDLQYFH